MKKNILTACMLCGTLNLTAQTASSGLNIIPTPLETKITEGAFQFNPLTTQVAAKGKEAKETTDFFKSKIKKCDRTQAQIWQGICRKYHYFCN